MTVESLLARLRAEPHPHNDVAAVTAVQPYGNAGRSRNGSEKVDIAAVTGLDPSPLDVTAATGAGGPPLQREPHGHGGCTAVTALTSQSQEKHSIALESAFMPSLTAQMDTTPTELIAARVNIGAPDDRRYCRTCGQLDGTRCWESRLTVMDDLPRRCIAYAPLPDDPDQRTGREMWPGLIFKEETT